jgi:hypothetical protein
MSCNTEGCQTVQRFVATFMASKPGIAWSVSEEVSDLSVSVSLLLPDQTKRLVVSQGQAFTESAGLDDSTKQTIAAWLKENL